MSVLPARIFARKKTSQGLRQPRGEWASALRAAGTEGPPKAAQGHSSTSSSTKTEQSLLLNHATVDLANATKLVIPPQIAGHPGPDSPNSLTSGHPASSAYIPFPSDLPNLPSWLVSISLMTGLQ